jgi:uncharacterized HAD superfamily protein
MTNESRPISTGLAKIDGGGKRLNSGKTRHDLTPAFAQEQYARVMTFGADRYGDHNWQRGMAWSKVLASLERHLQAIKRGEDFDQESGLLHSAHVMCNAAFLSEYYKIYPQGDDRQHGYMEQPRIGLDVDEVIADWLGHWCKYHNQEVPNYWSFDYNIRDKFNEMKDNKEFWMTIPPKVDPRSLGFEPHCYVTSRVVPSEWTQEWIQKVGFPAAPVYTVGHGQSKIQVLKDAGVEIFVDDRYENFVDINRAGILCYLLSTPHNQRYNVGHKRIENLQDLVR